MSESFQKTLDILKSLQKIPEGSRIFKELQDNPEDNTELQKASKNFFLKFSRIFKNFQKFLEAVRKFQKSLEFNLLKIKKILPCLNTFTACSTRIRRCFQFTGKLLCHLHIGHFTVPSFFFGEVVLVEVEKEELHLDTSWSFSEEFTDDFEDGADHSDAVQVSPRVLGFRVRDQLVEGLEVW